MDLEQGFWQAYQRFLKTPLVTEQPNPLTVNLSGLAQTDLPAAYALLRQIDLDVIEQVSGMTSLIEAFQRRAQTSERIILVGCGASGRIAMQMEYWARAESLKVEAILAGGDVTLIEAIESCEDNPEFARAQMALLNLGPKDWVIGLSAGGEAPFILEALRVAKNHTKERPTLICCNPVHALLERDSAHPASNPDFEIIPLVVGEMALTGSTRMQATTAITLFLILSLLPSKFKVESWRNFYASLDLKAFCGLTIWEALRFQAGERVTYHAESALALPILSDMTERAPTFNLPRLHYTGDQINTAHSALILKDAENSEEAWRKLLGRPPKALQFDAFPKTEMDYLLGFDLSRQAEDSPTKIDVQKAYPTCFDGARRPGVSAVEIQFLLRLILVNHSTLMMGRCGFYTGNLMTSLKPGNFKLIDRAIRYVQFLKAQQTGQSPRYEDVARLVFKRMPSLKPGESIVFKALEQELS